MPSKYVLSYGYVDKYTNLYKLGVRLIWNAIYKSPQRFFNLMFPETVFYATKYNACNADRETAKKACGSAADNRLLAWKAVKCNWSGKPAWNDGEWNR